ncbi:MAG: alkaline phosphatase [bacterium]
MKNRLMYLFLGCALFATSCVSNSNNEENLPAAEVKNVIYMIGDGMGVSQIQVALTALGGEKTAFDMCQYSGFARTYSSSNYITDSAASGTALATGNKTNNGVIGMSADSTNVYSVLKDFEDTERPTGLVVTSYITHATPAAFYAHQVSRNLYEEIAVDLLHSGVDYFAGGGRKHFINRADSVNLVDSLIAKGYEIDFELDLVEPVKSLPYGLLAADDHMPSFAERGGFLPAAVEQAINSLDAEDKGFFLMVEGSQIDFCGHGNDQTCLTGEMLDFERAVQIALDFAAKDGNTLVVITADHETGGAVVLDGSYADSTLDVTFTTGNHTGTIVPIFSYGPSAEKFSGIMENIEIPQRIREIMEK